MKIKKDTHIWLVGFSCLVVIVCMALLGLALWFIFVLLDGPSDQDIDEAMKQGDIILLAIKEYHTENGAYPSALTDLVPNTLNQIPNPDGVEEFWKYYLWPVGSTMHGSEYQLSHDWGGWYFFPNPVISSSGSGWLIDTK